MKSRIAGMSIRPLALAILSGGILAGCDVGDTVAPKAADELATDHARAATAWQGATDLAVPPAGADIRRSATVTGLASVSASELVTITFDELPRQSVDGLSVKGVTFFFTIGGASSFDAQYNVPGPSSDYIDAPALQGNSSGELTLVFEVPTTVVEFGVALTSGSVLEPGVFVELFNSTGTSLGVTPVTTNPFVTPFFSVSEAQFKYSGSAVAKAVLTFQPELRFMLDNLTFSTAAPVDPTTRADCMNGGWEQYGFRNQGQCVRFVETGKDSR